MDDEPINEMRKFVAPEIVFGLGAIELAGQYVKNLGGRKVLVVSDAGVVEAGWTEKAIKSLDQENLVYECFFDVTPNPRAAQVMHGAEVYLDHHCDAILAVGGGSPMDCAKGIGIVAGGGGHILDYEGVDRVEFPIPPLICVPTTSGSSADVSQFAIITDTNRRVKIAIVSKAVVPDVALLDPWTTTTKDAYLTACTGLDALTHAIEAYVSTAHSPLTDLHALEAIRLLRANLTSTIAKPQNIVLRSRVMLASLYAGLAFSNAILGAVHAMAHSLGGFLDLPHGECNAILLEHVINYNFIEAPKRYRDIARAMAIEVQGLDDVSALGKLLDGIRELRKASGVTRTLSDLGVRKEDIEQLASKACSDACLVTNPRTAGQAELEAIYEKAL
jgi:alcohol dehydrogenase class IV